MKKTSRLSLIVIVLALAGSALAYQGGSLKNHNHTAAAGDGGQLSNLSVDSITFTNAQGIRFSDGSSQGTSAGGAGFITPAGAEITTGTYVSITGVGTLGSLIVNPGNVGIGTSNPASSLEIDAAGNALVNTVNSLNNIVTGGASKFGTIRFSDNLTYSSYLNWNNSFLGFTGPGAAGTSLAINGAGNIGIGTTAPASTLDINAGGAGTASPLNGLNVLGAKPSVGFNATTVLTVTGGAGGDSNGGTSGTGGTIILTGGIGGLGNTGVNSNNGGAISLTAGAGGNINTNDSSNAGNGANINISGGAGGNQTNGSGSGNSGTGGNLNLNGGNAGTKSGSGSQGNGGDLVLNPGTGNIAGGVKIINGPAVGNVVCIATGGYLGHCTAASACAATCTCTCAKN